MTRLRARAPKGKRAYGKVPRYRGKNTTLSAAITLEGAMGQPMTVEGGNTSKMEDPQTSDDYKEELRPDAIWQLVEVFNRKGVRDDDNMA
jgi:hypothetical protein